MSSTISVVIPTIGRPELFRAIDSVLQQTSPPRELIVVDNGPLEGAGHRQAAVHKAVGAALPLRWVSLPPRTGPGLSRNVGAWEAMGKYVAFLDDDDEFDATYLEKVAARLTSEHTTIVYAKKVYLGENGLVMRVKRLDSQPRERWLQRLYAQKNHGFGGTNLVVEKQTFFALGAFPVDLRTGQDRGFAIEALRSAHEVLYLDDAVVYCHIPTGYRAKLDPTKWLTNLKILVEYWGEMTWETRRTSIRKTLKIIGAFYYKRFRSRWSRS